MILEDKKLYFSAGLINTLSISEDKDLFILASCTSYSKSETALNPLKIIFDLYFLQRSVVRELNEITEIFFLFNFKSLNNALLTMFIRSSELNK